MTGLVKKIHIYLGLLCFSMLMVYGIAGLVATFGPPPAARLQGGPTVRHVDFQAPANVTDKEVAASIWKLLGVPLTAPPADWQLRRDPKNDLTFALYTPSGVDRVTVLEQEGRLRVEKQQFGFWSYINHLHAMTIRAPSTDWRIRAWAWYNEFSIFALLLMGATGVFLWLSSRPRHRLAVLSLMAGGGSFVILYVLSR